MKNYSTVQNQRSKLEKNQLQITIQKHETILLWESVLNNSSMKCDSKTNYEFKKAEWNAILNTKHKAINYFFKTINYS